MQSEFNWKLFPRAEKFLQIQVRKFLTKNSFAKILAERMEKETSTRFFDWIDHIMIPEKVANHKKIQDLGFEEKDKVQSPSGTKVFTNSESVFVPILIGNKYEIAIKPERIDHFLQIIGRGLQIEGELFSPYRRSIVYENDGYVLSAIERRGYDGYVVKETKDVRKYKEAIETFFCRRRLFETDNEGIKYTQRFVKHYTKIISHARVADAFFRTERVYWERKNRPGQVQKARQDRLGLGWGNHDHHTYRSSRENFVHLIKIFETMGYLCRERFHAGKQAGWGAQVLEHPISNIVVFADVDLTTHETEEDFAHGNLDARKKLGTVGLWVGLHGESILQAGMHHLEARFDFEKLVSDLKKVNVKTLPQFSNFSFLKQAFVQSERWKVEKSRLKSLLKSGSITKFQYNQFLKNGARGSHLENLQRMRGFKGFNQDSVSVIIKSTDPRLPTAKVRFA